MLLLVEAGAALLLGLVVGHWRHALVIFTVLYVLHAVPAALGWYGALSEWNDLPY